MTNAGSSAVNRIMDTQRIVASAEAEKLMELGSLFPLVTRRDLAALENVYEFVGELYFNLRLTEALAYDFRDEKGTTSFAMVRGLVDWARLQRSAIENQLVSNDSYTPTSGLEDLGKMFVEEKCRWALRLIDETFGSWGY